MAETAARPTRVKSPPMTTQARSWVMAATAACLVPLLLQLPTTLGLGFGLAALLIGWGAWRKPLPFLLRLLIGIGMIVAIAVVAPGVGRDTACMVLAAMLALKPSETASLRDGRSLVGFGLFAPFSTFLLDQGPASLALALLALIVALLALQQLAADEAGVRMPAGARWWVPATGVLKLLALGVPLALAAFWLFPRLPTPLWGLPDRAVARPGLSDTMSPGAWSNLLNDDSPAARVQFLGQAPARERMYWRGPVLWDFDGRTWRQIKGLQRIPPTPLADAPPWDYVIELEATENQQLVALDLPTAAPAGSFLGNDHSLYSERPLDNVTRWRMRSAMPDTVGLDLPEALRERALSLPFGFNPRTLALGQQWRREVGHDPDGQGDAAIAERALAMIRREFVYTLDVPLAGRNEIDDFLFDRKQGYCEHFSSAFVVLMRAAGIPARVVTGYAGGYRNPIGDYWLVRNSDAHAWAELWLPRRGWVRIDPTAAVAPERVFDTLADRQPGRIGAFDGLVPAFNAGDWLLRGWNDFVLGFDAQRQQQLLKPLGLDRIGGHGLILLFTLVAGLALAWMAWLIARGERERDPLLRAWHRLGRRYAAQGRGRAPHEPAGVWAARVAADIPSAGEPLVSLSQRFADARYAGIDAAGLRRLLRDLIAHRP